MSELTKTRAPITSDPDRPEYGAPAALLLVAIGGLIAGVATSWLQGELPGGWYVLADSGAVWTIVAFVLAAACAGQRWVVVTAATLVLLCEVAGYYMVTASARGIAVTMNDQVLWTVAALWIGPLTGLAAYHWRRGTGAQSVVCGVAVTGLVAGEGAQLLLRADQPHAGLGELVAAGALAGVLVLTSHAPWRYRGAALFAGGAVALATYLVYAETVLS